MRLSLICLQTGTRILTFPAHSGVEPPAVLVSLSELLLALPLIAMVPTLWRAAAPPLFSCEAPPPPSFSSARRADRLPFTWSSRVVLAVRTIGTFFAAFLSFVVTRAASPRRLILYTPAPRRIIPSLAHQAVVSIACLYYLVRLQRSPPHHLLPRRPAVLQQLAF